MYASFSNNEEFMTTSSNVLSEIYEPGGWSGGAGDWVGEGECGSMMRRGEGGVHLRAVNG